ncbi:MAG: RHS repeat-associated core domain-containing protein, partial [Bacteroidales bacterium]|nr:RHS repeat-associated core domain-containing protein [Bacteroidales bacterium]
AKELDEETGMYYYEARYYKPPVFTSRDPMMDQKPWLTPYHYCSNNPVGRVDPSGCEDAWVKTSNGVIFDSDVHNQADAEKRYGNDASILPYGSHKINGKDVYLSYDGKYIIDRKVYYAKDCASFLTKFAKLFEEGHSDGANMGRITKEDLQKGLPIIFGIVSCGATIEAIAAKKVLSAIISGLGTLNCIDDACADSEGVTPLEKYAGGEYPIVIQVAKNAIDATNVVNGIYDIAKYGAKTFGTASAVSSSISTINGVRKTTVK